MPAIMAAMDTRRFVPLPLTPFYSFNKARRAMRRHTFYQATSLARKHVNYTICDWQGSDATSKLVLSIDAAPPIDLPVRNPQ